MTTLDEINQAPPIEGSHTIKTHGHYNGWPITIQIVHLNDARYTLRIQQRPDHRPDTPPQTVFMPVNRLAGYIDQLRDAAENGRLTKNPPLPRRPFTVQPTDLGLKVRYMRAEYFFVKGAHTFEATKSQWETRGFKVKKGAKRTKHLSIWHVRSYYEFTLYHVDDCEDIGGKKAKWRRDDFQHVINLLVDHQKEMQKLLIYPKLPL